MKKILALLLAALMVLSMVACSAASETEITEAPAAETAEAAEEAAFTTVTEGVLTVSCNAQFPPYEMVADDGSFEGIDMEIAGAIADYLGLALQIDDMDFQAALMAAQEGKSDLVMSGVSVTEERLEVMNFSNPYATAVQVVIIPEGSDVTIDNLGEKMIGTQAGTTGNIYCADDYGDEHVIAYDTGASAVQALVNGQIDCVVIDDMPAQEYVAANTGLTILDTEYVTEEYAIGMSKDNTALLDAVNEALEALTADGTIDAIVAKYISAE